METIIRNGTVFSGVEKGCGNCGQPFLQMVERYDVTSFQLRNNCLTEKLSPDLLSEGRFDEGLFYWEQKASGESFTASGSGACVGPAGGLPTESMLLRQAITGSPGCLHLVACVRVSGLAVGRDHLHVSLTAADESEITELGVIDQDGEYCFSFNFTAGAYLSFRVSIGSPNIISIEEVSLRCNEGCYGFCVVNTNGDSYPIRLIPYEASVSHLSYRLDWANLENEDGTPLNLPEGCYSLCICEGFAGENIFIHGGNGHFENNMEGITSLYTVLNSKTKSHSGNYSLAFQLPGGASSFLDLAESGEMEVLASHHYTFGAWIALEPFGPPPGGVSIPAICRLEIVSADTGALEGTVYYDLNCTGLLDWLYIHFDFKAKMNTRVKLIFRFIDTEAASTLWTWYVDDILLYDIDAYQPCSRVFNLRERHEDSILLEWGNSSDAFGFKYVPDSGKEAFKQKLRLHGKLRNMSGKGFRENVLGKYAEGFVLSAETEIRHELILEELPEYLHKALMLAVDCDYFYINGKKYYCPEPDYEPEYRGSSRLAPVRIVVAEEYGREC